MAELWHVRPTARTQEAARAAGVSISIALTHPAGPMPAAADADGRWAFWPADQHTFRLIEDGAIERAPGDAQKPAAAAPARADKPKE